MLPPAAGSVSTNEVDQSTGDCETIPPPARSGAFGYTPPHDEGDIMSVASISRGRITSATSRYLHLLALLAAVIAPLAFTNTAAALERGVLTIHTTKPLGPALGQFSASGAFSDSGVLVTERRIVSALPSPFGVVTHLVLRFEGQFGTFTIEAQIIETVTADPNIFANEGNWAVVDGTGAYATLHGTGDVEGTVDDATNLITRDYVGLVHFK